VELRLAAVLEEVWLRLQNWVPTELPSRQPSAAAVMAPFLLSLPLKQKSLAARCMVAPPLEDKPLLKQQAMELRLAAVQEVLLRLQAWVRPEPPPQQAGCQAQELKTEM